MLDRTKDKLKYKSKKFKISYSYVAIDIFHYGHLKLLKEAKKNGDIHICGLLADEICEKWNGNLVMNYKERYAILKSLVFVDKIIKQKSIDPTENLKKIHTKYPDAKIVLFEGHQEWKNMPGSIYVRSIDGNTIKPEFYSRLTRNSIRNKLNNSITDSAFDIESYIVGNISYFSSNSSSKAKVLNSLTPLLKQSRIEDLFVFKVSNWETYSKRIITEIKNRFDGKIIVRSSTSLEDNLTSSNAGLFHSELNVKSNCSEAVTIAIDKVVESYKKKLNNLADEQILIQKQTQDIKINGVVLTRDILRNSPYYVVNYDLGNETNTVTAGISSKNIRIIKNIGYNKLNKPWKQLIKAVNEIEKLLDGLALDIEFAIKNNNEVIIFQVRPLAAVNRFVNVPDENIYDLLKLTISRYDFLSKHSIIKNSYTLSDMSFWNPAEIIGSKPDNLSYSLYKYILLNQEWNRALSSLGYKKIDRPIMVRILNKPYIEVETAFRSLMPENICGEIEKKLLKIYLTKLKKTPELHDKIEFEISHNCFLPKTNDQINSLKSELGEEYCNIMRESLIEITQNIFYNFKQIEKNDLESIKSLNLEREKKKAAYDNLSIQNKISLIIEILDDIKIFGAVQFSRMARLAFIGNQFFKSLIECNVISKESANYFLSSIDTIATKIKEDYKKVINNKITVENFNDIYGHLRPGTYNINILPYSKDSNYFNIHGDGNYKKVYKEDLEKNDKTLRKNIDEYLTGFELDIDAETLLSFIEKTTKYRESFKFEFTKNLSLSIEWLADIGKTIGFNRKELSYLCIENLRAVSSSTSVPEIYDLWSAQINGHIEKEEISKYITLPSIIFKSSDIENVIIRSSAPNFITTKNLISEAILLEDLDPNEYKKINDKILLIEQADPGFDWVFSKNIKGLITKYGGVASHMAIRCSEFEIPAAIGCGELLYSELKRSKMINLDCSKKHVTSI